MGVNVSRITNYENYFDKDVSENNIFYLILEFKKHSNQKKIEMLYIHLDKDYEIDDIIKKFRNYYEQKKVDDIIMEFKNYYKQKKVKLDDISNLLVDFREYYNQKN